jgi:hypothetical protein
MHPRPRTCIPLRFSHYSKGYCHAELSLPVHATPLPSHNGVETCVWGAGDLAGTRCPILLSSHATARPVQLNCLWAVRIVVAIYL